MTIVVVPSVNELDCTVHVVDAVVALRKRHSVVAPLCAAASNIWNEATIPLPALCEIVTVCPATVTVPALAAPVLAATDAVTEPLPVPLAPDVTLMKEELLVADHAQVLLDVTAIVTVPALLPVDAVVGETLKLHALAVLKVSVLE